MNFDIGIAGIILYGFLFIMIIVSISWSAVFVKMGLSTLATNVRRTFRSFLLLFIAVRIIWLSLLTFSNENDFTFVLNRLAIVLFITAFTLVVFYWAERFHKKYYETKSFLPQLGWLFVLANIILYIFQLVIIVMWFIGGGTREGNPIYNTTIIADVVISSLLSVGFLVYGILLFCVTKNTDDGETTNTRTTELLKILFITGVFTLCFLIRVFMFSWRPLTNKYFPTPIFYTFAYYVPELIPCAIQIYLSETGKEKQEKDSKFIDGLYQDSQESIEDYRERNIIGVPKEDTYLLDNGETGLLVNEEATN